MDRLLCISNEPFSLGSANGRTLMNLLREYDRAALAQFYIHGKPDTTFCSNYFCVSDRAALNAFLHRKEQQQAQPGEKPSGGNGAVRPVRKSCRNRLLRDIVWQSCAWWTTDFDAFLDNFAPQIVLLQAGDAPFMYAIARKIARRYNARLVMYNSENYVLKQYLYAGARQEGIWHTLLKHRLKTQYRRFMQRADFCIYSTEQLEEDYQNAYPHAGRSLTLYTVSELKPKHPGEPSAKDRFHLVYCGNLGVGRVKPLAELARILNEVDPDAKLEIYGRFVSQAEQELLCAEPNVMYHGVVDYSSVSEVLQTADMIVHCENSERLINLRAAFSTKIADSLAVGTPFLVYADKGYPFVQYLLRNRCAHIAGDTEELREILNKCRCDLPYRWQFIPNALETAKANHSVQNNCSRFNAAMESLSCKAK